MLYYIICVKKNYIASLYIIKYFIVIYYIDCVAFFLFSTNTKRVIYTLLYADEVFRWT